MTKHSQNPHLIFLNLRFSFFQNSILMIQINNLSFKLPPFKILLNLVSNSSDSQRNLKWGFHCTWLNTMKQTGCKVRYKQLTKVNEILKQPDYSKIHFTKAYLNT
jgi:hypothetical protein